MSPLAISVVVPVYNTHAYLKECIRALQNQNFPADQYEIIMVDNNSTDASAEIIKSHACIRYAAEPTQSSYAARNKGVSESRGEIIAFTDSDCAPEPDWLKNLAAAMANPDIRIAMGHRQFASEAGIMRAVSAYESEMSARVFGGTRSEHYFGYTNNMAVRRHVFNTLKPFAEIKRGADSAFVLAAAAHYGCDAISFAPDVGVRHLEMKHLRDYFRKKIIYGGVRKSMQNRPAPTTPPVRERLRMCRAAARKTGGGPLMLVQLFMVLVIGSACFQYGYHRGLAAVREEGKNDRY